MGSNKKHFKKALLDAIKERRGITKDELLTYIPANDHQTALAALDELESENVINIDLLQRCSAVPDKTTATAVIAEYIKDSEVVMAELLASKKADGLTIEEAFKLYIECMKRANGDRFFFAEGTSEAAMDIDGPKGYTEL